MRSDAPRHLRCPKCRALKGLVPLGLMPHEPTLEVAVLPMRRWVRRKFLDVTMNKYKMIGMNIQEQTAFRNPCSILSRR